MPNKKKKLMVCGFDGQIRTNIARNIIQKTKTYPSIIYTSETETYCNNKFFNNSFIIDSFKLRQGIFNDNFFLENSIDKNLYFELSKLERLICYNLEDTTGFNFSYKQRLNYFYDLLLHTTNLLKKYKPNLIIFWTLPHTSENVVLYQIAKKLKIKTLFMEHIFQIKRVGFFSSIDGFPNNFIKNTNIKKSSKLFNLYYQNIINSRNDKHIRTYNKKFKFSFFKELILYLIYFFHKKLIMAYKINKLTFGKHSVMRIRHLHFFNLRAFVSNVLIYKYYENLCKNFKINLNDKYIIFFSSFQPEASTYIHSEYYDNQEYALRMLNDILPSNYKIYYKEYPKNNLHKHSKLFLSRNREYYQRLSKIKKLVFISSNYNNENFIKNSQFVATLTGSAGWEASLIGKKVIIFGNVFYSKLKNVFLIKSKIDLIKAFNAKLNPTIQSADIKKMLKYYYDNTYDLLSDNRIDLSESIKLPKIQKTIENRFIENIQRLI